MHQRHSSGASLIMKNMSHVFTRQYVNAFIDKEIPRRQSNKVLHGHPSPAMWKPLEEPVESLLEKRKTLIQGTHTLTNLYIGTPFCIKTEPKHCGFCLFASEDYKGNKDVEDYIAYLKKDFRLHEPYYKDDKVSSIYFGGGTPNLYKPKHYGQIMGFVDQLYGGVPEGIEVTLEGIPQLFTDEKVKAMAECGINRISMGVQQISDKLIKYSGRNQTRKQVLEAVELCHKYNMANSMDLIYGWPEQTIEDMLNDLREAVESGVHHITHYELNIAGRSDFAKKPNRDLLPTIEQNTQAYHIAKEYLLSQGFDQITVYDWKRTPKRDEDDRLSRYEYEQNMHRFDHVPGEEKQSKSQVCAMGFSGISFHPNGDGSDSDSWIYMNSRASADYKELLSKGEFPVERGFMYTEHDLMLAWLFQSMQTMKIDTKRFKELYSVSIDDHFGSVWSVLQERQWITKNDDLIEFIDDGQYFIPLLQSLMANPRVTEMRDIKARKIQDIPVLVEA